MNDEKLCIYYKYEIKQYKIVAWKILKEERMKFKKFWEIYGHKIKIKILG